jgi:hypothetical protein
MLNNMLFSLCFDCSEGGFVEMPSSQQVHLSVGKVVSPSTAQVAAIILNAASAISTPHVSKGIAFVDDDENSVSDVSG